MEEFSINVLIKIHSLFMRAYLITSIGRYTYIIQTCKLRTFPRKLRLESCLYKVFCYAFSSDVVGKDDL